MNKVINFHNINDVNWFEKALMIIKSKYTLISIHELLASFYYGRNLSNTCHITFDDGDKSFSEIIHPILKCYNIPASLFVSPKICREGRNFWFQEIADYNFYEIKRIISDQFKINYFFLKEYSVFNIFKALPIDQIWSIIYTYQKLHNIKPKESQNIQIKQLLEIDRHGLVVIGAHTQNHPILANEDLNRSTKEITESVLDLKDILGHEVSFFAYPNGLPEIDFGLREENVLREIGCKLAFSTSSKSVKSNKNPLSIPRYGFISGDSEKYIKAKLFLDEYWYYMKKIISKNDKTIRLEIRRIINPEYYIDINTNE